MKSSNQDFMNALLKLEAIEVIGLAKIMSIPVLNEENKPIAAEEILSNMIVKYDSYNRNKRRTIMKIITGSIKG